jgi:AP-2 complex subunit mu-1
MISLVLLINSSGEILISRQYRDDVPVDAATAFRIKVIAAKESGTKPPVVILDGTSYMYTRHNDIYLVAATCSNAHPAMVFHFLYGLRKVFQDYFGAKFTEEDVRDNFCLTYELLDEVLDFGYPQILATDLLKKYINNGEVMTAEAAQKWTDEVTGAVDWRSNPGPVYAKNEIFIDVLEDVNLLMSANGVVLRNEVVGKVMMKTFLTGMPECKFGLNDKLSLSKQSTAKKSSVELDDCTFHRCVKLGKFEADRSITFVPPDGEFELMRYRITDNVNLPFRVLPIIEEHGANHVEMNIQVRRRRAHIDSSSAVRRRHSGANLDLELTRRYGVLSTHPLPSPPRLLRH